jgi:opacity protein-like surface antigen
MRRLLPVVLLMAATPAFAQRTEVSLLGGYTTAGDVDMKAAGIDELTAGGGFTWGAAAGWFFTDDVGFEASWSRQEGAVTIGTGAASADLFDMNSSLLHGSVVYRFGADNARLVPFVLAGAGATFLSAEDVESETKFSWTLGAGIKWLASERVGVRAQVRYVPTMLSDESSDFCDPFGFCQGSLNQFEMTGGLVLRF